MVLESYDKYEFQLIECNGYTPTQLVRKLNEMGNEGWRVVYPSINEDAWNFAPVKRLVDFVSDASDD